MKNLISGTYIPFGTQYYRAPSPHREDWDRDLKKISELGFNTVKYWIQWRWNNPAMGEYYFDDIDELMELASKYNLKVMLNTIFDVAPAWIYKKYPDASMITLGGKKIGPQTQPHRQIGGLGYCFNHDDVTKHQFEFLRTAVERYKDHPALEIWNVGSEPELTSSMAEMRAYATNADKIDDMMCYCENCQRKFRLWLGEKYKTVENLNLSWNRNYQSFSDVEVPKGRNTFNDVIDWRMFFVHTIGENVKKRFETAASVDKGKHPLMCHHVFIQGFPVTSTASDPWNVGRFGDLHGFTQMDDAAMIDILRSCAKGKPVISAEMLALMGYTLDMPKTIGDNEVKRFIFSGVAGNLKGFIFWQYRPEILGREAPTWGLTFLDGSETPWLKSFAESGQVLQKNAEFLLNAEPNKAEVAILYNPENQIFAWASTGNEFSATDSLLGVHKALYDYNYKADFVHPVEFEKGDILSNYKVLVVPFPYVINKKIADAMKKFVENGGLLIGESYFAGWNIEEGCHAKVVPGYGLHEVFGMRQGVVDPADKEEGVDLKLAEDLPLIKKGVKVTGAIVQERFFLEGAKALAKFEDGKPAATIANYGKGKAIAIGSYVGMDVIRNQNDKNARFIAGLLDKYSGIDKPNISVAKRVRIDLLKDGDGSLMMIIQNKEKKPVKGNISVKDVMPKKMTEQFSGETLAITKSGKTASFEIQLDAEEVKVFRG